MEVSILKLPGGSARWNLVVDYMVLRRKVFVDEKKWDLVSSQEMEFEQYDSVGHAYYVIAHDEGRVLAGCRLIQCDSTIGKGSVTYSYMLRDAFLKLIQLPSELCDVERPTSPRYWELTRLVAVPGNRLAVKNVMSAAHAFLIEVGAVGCLCLASPIVRRLASVSGFQSKTLGPVCGDQSGKFIAFEIAIAKNAEY